MGEPATSGISLSLARLGLELARFKTGTPPRINGRTIDYDKTELQPGDDEPEPFSFLTERIDCRQVPCWITYTTPPAHELIRANLHRAPMFTGQIQSTGPRYCPSIETKIVRFADKPRHQLFLEPEGRATHEVYVNGLATSLPRDVQDALLRLIPGIEQAEILRYGYAIEYDYLPPTQLKPSLETKRWRACTSPARSTARPATRKPPPKDLSPAPMPRSDFVGNQRSCFAAIRHISA